MLCPQCQQEIHSSDRFCPFCATRIAAPTPETASAPPEQPWEPDATSAATQPIAAPATAMPRANEAPELQPAATSCDYQTRIQELNQLLNGSADLSAAWARQETRCAPELQTSLSGTTPGAPFRRNATEYEAADEARLNQLPLRVEYAVNRYILTGNNAAGKKPVNLELRIQEKEKPLQDVQVWTIIHAGREQEVIFWNRPWNHQGKIFSNILPYDLKWNLDGGDLLIDCYLLCQFPENTECFTFFVKHAVIAPGQTGQQIINSYNITAGDGSVIKEIDLKALGTSGDSLIDSLNCTQAFFCPMSCRETDWRPEDLLLDQDNVYARFACEKLTLEYGEQMLHLCARETVKFGRSFSQNDVVISDWSDEQHFFGAPTMTVSHCHGCLQYFGSHLGYKDFSTFGTRIQLVNSLFKIHQTSPTGTQCKLPEACKISFGNIVMELNILTCPARKREQLCLNCRQNACRALIMKRRDNLPETFLFIWQCCELNAALPELANYTIYRRNGGFMLRTPEDKLINLAPDMNIPLLNGNTIRVSRFYQPFY